MRIGIFYRDINTDVGDSYDVRKIVKELSKNNQVTVFCSLKNKHKLINDNISYIQTNNIFSLLSNVYLTSKQFDFFHLFCGFIYSIPFVAMILRIRKVKYTYSPFGQLMPLAIKKDRFKKTLFLKLLLKPMLNNSSFIHANSQYEKNVLANLNISSRILISSLGVDGYEVEGYSKVAIKKYYSFIGRIDIWHKGLDIMIEAIKLIEDQVRYNNIVFIIAGRASNTQLRKLIDLITKYEIDDIIEIKQNISEEEKMKILQESYYFIHPSRVEGFARSMREAINCEIPLITTFDSNVGDYVQEYNAGFSCSFDADKLSKCIAKSIALKDTSFGVQILKKRLTWYKLGHDLLEEYNNA